MSNFIESEQDKTFFFTPGKEPNGKFHWYRVDDKTNEKLFKFYKKHEKERMILLDERGYGFFVSPDKTMVNVVDGRKSTLYFQRPGLKFMVEVAIGYLTGIPENVPRETTTIEKLQQIRQKKFEKEQTTKREYEKERRIKESKRKLWDDYIQWLTNHPVYGREYQQLLSMDDHFPYVQSQIAKFEDEHYNEYLESLPKIGCQICSNPSTFICGKCKISSYCSKKCQITDWNNNHNFLCK